MRAELTDAWSRLDACVAEAELIRLARRCLARTAPERPRDAGVLAAELTAHLESVETRLRQSELGRAKEGERKRRRLTLALTALVLVAVLLTGGWLWLEREQAHRDRHILSQRVERAQQIRDALVRAGRLHEQARSANDLGKWAAARAAAGQAEALLEPKQSEDAESVHALQRTLEEEEAAFVLAGRLEEIRLSRGPGLTDAPLADTAASAAFDAAFRSAGLAFDKLDPEAAAARLRQGAPLSRALLVAALDDWISLLPADEAAKADRLGAVVARADPDPWRQRVRAARNKKDRQALERLADDKNLAQQPAQTLLLLALSLRACGSGQAAEALLRRAQEHHPGDFWIAYELARQLSAEGKRPQEVVRFLTAALALRPQSPAVRRSLAAALKRTGP
jgi:eukaryotic-like serine/threonine-protein kinase